MRQLAANAKAAATAAASTATSTPAGAIAGFLVFRASLASGATRARCSKRANCCSGLRVVH